MRLGLKLLVWLFSEKRKIKVDGLHRLTLTYNFKLYKSDFPKADS